MTFLPEITLSKLLLFADDSKIYRQIRNVMDQIDMQTDLHKMFFWSEKWFLKINGKCKIPSENSQQPIISNDNYYTGDNHVPIDLFCHFLLTTSSVLYSYHE